MRSLSLEGMQSMKMDQPVKKVNLTMTCEFKQCMYEKMSVSLNYSEFYWNEIKACL